MISGRKLRHVLSVQLSPARAEGLGREHVASVRLAATPGVENRGRHDVMCFESHERTACARCDLRVSRASASADFRVESHSEGFKQTDKLPRHPRVVPRRFAILLLFQDLGHFVQLRREPRLVVRDVEPHDLPLGELAVPHRLDESVDSAARQSRNRYAVALPAVELLLEAVGLVVDLDHAIGIDAEVREDGVTDGALLFELGVALVDDVEHEVGGHAPLPSSNGTRPRGGAAVCG